MCRTGFIPFLPAKLVALAVSFRVSPGKKSRVSPSGDPARLLSFGIATGRASSKIKSFQDCKSPESTTNHGSAPDGRGSVRSGPTGRCPGPGELRERRGERLRDRRPGPGRQPERRNHRNRSKPGLLGRSRRYGGGDGGADDGDDHHTGRSNPLDHSRRERRRKRSRHSPCSRHRSRRRDRPKPCCRPR